MIKLLINNGDGRGDVDYSQYVIPSSINVEDSINTPTLVSFTLSNTNGVFMPPVRSAYVKLISTLSPLTLTGGYIATGFVTNTPQFKFLGLGQRASSYLQPGPVPKAAYSGQLFHHYEMDYKITSDEYLLNIKAVPFIAAFVNRTMGQILSNIATVLAPGYFDLSGIQDGDIVPYFSYDPTQKFSDVAKQFSDTAGYRYQAIARRITFAPYGDAPLGIMYNEMTQRQTQLVPGALNTGILAVPLVNDAIVVGDVEPQQNHEDYFCGDGFTGNFPLRYTTYHGATDLLLQEDWTENQVNTSLWEFFDPAAPNGMGQGGQFSLVGALNCISAEGSPGPLGDTYILCENGVELGGHIVLQHGEFQFNDVSWGLVGGLYTQESNLVNSDCLFGFDIRPTATVIVTASGADGIQISPLVSGGLVGTPIVTVHNHHYILETFFSVRTYSRYNQTYRTLAGTPWGDEEIAANGDVTLSITDIDLGQAYNVATLNNPYVPPYTPVITKYTAYGVPVPSFAGYVLLNSGGPIAVSGGQPGLNVTVNYTMIWKPPQGTLHVNSLTGAQPANVLALTGGQLPPYDPNDPLAMEDTFPIGPPVHYPLGFGIDQDITATIQHTGDNDTLEFYQNTIPGVGARIRFQAWEAEHAVARVQDPVSIAREAMIVGDDGLRTGVFTDLKPSPRTSYDCDNAAAAIIADREETQYDGSYLVESYFWDQTQDYPRSGRYFNVTAPNRGISGAQFLVRSVAITFLELYQEVLQFQVSFGQDLFLEKLLRRFIIQPSGTPNLLQPTETALAPNPQNLPAPISIGEAGSFDTYLTNLPDLTASLITGTQVVCTVNEILPSGTIIEIRRGDTGWGSNAQNLLTTTNAFVFTLPRTSFDQQYFMRAVQYVPELKTSRFSKVLRVNYPMVPLPPSSVSVAFGSTVQGQQTAYPFVTVSLPTTFERNIYGVQIGEPLPLVPPQRVTIVSDDVGDITRSVQLDGFDSLGNLITEILVLDGTVPVASSNVFAYLLDAEIIEGGVEEVSAYNFNPPLSIYAGTVTQSSGTLFVLAPTSPNPSSPPNPSSLIVFINGVYQTQGLDYTVSGVNIVTTISWPIGTQMVVF